MFPCHIEFNSTNANYVPTTVFVRRAYKYIVIAQLIHKLLSFFFVSLVLCLFFGLHARAGSLAMLARLDARYAFLTKVLTGNVDYYTKRLYVSIFFLGTIFFRQCRNVSDL